MIYLWFLQRKFDKIQTNPQRQDNPLPDYLYQSNLISAKHVVDCKKPINENTKLTSSHFIGKQVLIFWIDSLQELHIVRRMELSHLNRICLVWTLKQ